ncbi:MAG: UDP-N-acetylmuramoyl-tripeptide--D-alanyl-D-alanine ligase [Lunatimonas sp.]|uniref:UDP-N-acetylmuramoyl-tripeptide--D-alanyl-D- alanine ligase n=1 Tax=Lunatimonas sp. TaxID=2060141 RepID=UPI00263BD0D3|nr:UDP-N-acetylmuramoyl-tripeptide--D-alanyl-D-alanine ligase [Lunatimonas sp.]MCC5936347.1 UDP-N-acetylmuramoyl-tripeptide--D-alanyl-D-alanine ligase [Lunatimonas sp.]
MEIEQLYRTFLASTGVCTDTRKIARGNLFFALKGPNFDANTFSDQALEQGACAVVVDNPDVARPEDDRYIVVPDTLRALQELARFHRDQLDIPIFGLTGSNGKTTTKELLFAVLSRKFRAHATSGNLNNHIGVPLTLLEIGSDTELAIIEMGANKQGDIQELCGIAHPTHGLITNIGKAHLEGMGGLEGVLKTKTELFQHLRESGGRVFINTRQEVFTNMIRRFADPVLFPEKDSFCEVSFVSADPFVCFRVEGSEQVFQSQLIGKYNFDNIAAAIAVGKFFGISPLDSAEAAAAYRPANMRSQLIEKRSNLILLDAYNANPSSMEAALLAFDRMDGKPNKMVIVGDMLELGEHTEAEHRRLGELLAGMSVDKVCLSGTLVQHALAKAPKALYFPDPFSLRNWLLDSQLEDYLILIKGSRGMRLETLVDFI